MKPVRIVLGTLPHLLRDIVIEVIGNQEDLQLVGSAPAKEGLRELLRAARADVFLCEEASLAGAEERERLLHEVPGLHVLVLTGTGRDADLAWLEPRCMRRADISPAQLVQLMRCIRAKEAGA